MTNEQVIKSLFLSLIFLLIPYVESRTEDHIDFISDCSSVYFLMAFVEEEELQAYSRHLSDLGEIFLEIAGYIDSLKNNSNKTFGYWTDLRNKKADKIIAKFSSDKEDVINLYMRCDIVRIRMNKIFDKSGKINQELLENFIENFSIPKRISSNQKVLQIEQMLDLSMKNLEKYQITSIVEFYKNLNR
ncbi:hypothetical protein N9V57_05325 [SAR86 cluster bacterium]|nr:hypothetical protein [SAR86 cluster bacterium]